MQVFYINLARRPDRNEEFLRRNAAIADCRRVDAIDGGSLKIDTLATSGIIAERLEAYSPGALACALSHKQLWERAVSTAAPITIAEDDAVLNRCFSARAASVIARLPDDWDIVFWGWNFDSILDCQVIPGLKQCVMHFDPRPLREKQDCFQEIDVDP